MDDKKIEHLSIDEETSKQMLAALIRFDELMAEVTRITGLMRSLLGNRATPPRQYVNPFPLMPDRQGNVFPPGSFPEMLRVPTFPPSVGGIKFPEVPFSVGITGKDDVLHYRPFHPASSTRPSQLTAKGTEIVEFIKLNAPAPNGDVKNRFKKDFSSRASIISALTALKHAGYIDMKRINGAMHWVTK